MSRVFGFAHCMSGKWFDDQSSRAWDVIVTAL
jgi:hypothetical protein